MSREMRRIYKTVHMSGREKDDKEGAKDEEEKEGAEERAVKDASERSSWKECGHAGEGREVIVVRYPGIHNDTMPTAKAETRPEKGGHV
jgi:hypothetical protein